MESTTKWVIVANEEETRIVSICDDKVQLIQELIMTAYYDYRGDYDSLDERTQQETNALEAQLSLRLATELDFRFAANDFRGQDISFPDGQYTYRLVSRELGIAVEDINLAKLGTAHWYSWNENSSAFVAAYRVEIEEHDKDEKHEI
jgi:hypothetical protein